ncbi:hypothetical protein [Pseudoalteromonas sp. TB64]|uniref:hypothetical protein n=1 Tax=Pseudoalteromonas sp. TB64 TaxID=1938600 RepID=UPI00040B0410|nr:hypothetical protein [Pseudoalteromonas sp. TB64]
MINEELNDCYPGAFAKKDGYIPVAICDIGSGNPYFINTIDGINGPLYRVYYDVVTSENYDKDSGMDKVLDCYEQLLKYKVT